MPRTTMSAGEAEYRKLVTAFGRGFHPDTRGDEYLLPLPSGWTAERVDRVVQRAADEGLDLYAAADDALRLHEARMEKLS